MPLRAKQPTVADVLLAMEEMRVIMAGERDVSQGLLLETSKGFPVIGTQPFSFLLE